MVKELDVLTQKNEARLTIKKSKNFRKRNMDTEANMEMKPFTDKTEKVSPYIIKQQKVGNHHKRRGRTG